MTRYIKAFDPDTIHHGNKGISVDHETVAGKVRELLGRMTLAQKINEIRGRQAEPIDGLYYAGGDDSLAIPPYKMVDGPRGARAGNATAFPVAMARGATFDVELERRVGLAIGLEVAVRGGNVLLAPTINLLRHPGWGRAQESYSEDTFHMGAMAVSFVSGVQNHVLASPKHFALNNVENTRFEMSANVDPRTLHEVYLPHFKRCVQEGVAASVMSAYNKMNETYCGEHPELLTNILRDTWGFTGFVESDWVLGTRSIAPALKAGLDIEMPAPYRFSDENLLDAIEQGELSEDDIDRAAGNALYQKIAYDLANLTQPDPSVVESDEHIALAQEVAEKSIVLLKNDTNILPLADEPGLRIAVVGELADEINLGDRGSSFVSSSEVTTPLQGLESRVSNAYLEYFPPEVPMEDLENFDVTIVIPGLTYKDEGEFIPTLQQEAENDSALARGGDREDLELPLRQRELIIRAAAFSNRTIVVLQGGSAIQVREWIDSVDALCMAWYPGREGGHAIARVLFGDVNPSGRLPVTFPKYMEQLVPWDVTSLEVEHDYLQGYRYVDCELHDPEYPFGFGLSYTTFSADNLYVEREQNNFHIRVDITNTGNHAGATVVQLYLDCPDSAVLRAINTLKGFGRVQLEPGETATLEIELPDSELAFYDVDTSEWHVEETNYIFRAGFSSRDLPLTSTWELADGNWLPTD